ncbi:MAG: hypothetical protein ABIE68_00175 [bacterium]
MWKFALELIGWFFDELNAVVRWLIILAIPATIMWVWGWMFFLQILAGFIWFLIFFFTLAMIFDLRRRRQ